MIKDGWKTSEFWLTLVAGIVPFVAGALPAPWLVVLEAAIVAAYSISRGLAKGGTPQALK